MTRALTRVVVVATERLPGWLDRFAAAHGPLGTTATADVVIVQAADGTTASVDVPFPPLPPGPVLTTLGRHARAVRRLGLVLVRRGGWAVGVADGTELVASKVGRRYVQGRTAAGGWSQQRYARRRDQQVTALVDDAVEAAARIVVPEAAGLAAVVGGGDRLLLDAVRADRRLQALEPLWSPRRLDVPDPRQAVLVEAVQQARSVRITLEDPPSG